MFVYKNLQKFSIISSLCIREQEWAKMRVDNIDFSFSCAYLSPSFDVNIFLEDLDDTVYSLLGASDAFTLTGDVNIDFLDDLRV